MRGSWEGWAVTSGGDPGRGRVLLEEGLALADQIGTKMLLSHLKATLAASLAALGELQAALSLCQEAVRLAEEAGDKLGQALAHRILADVLCRGNPPDCPGAERAIVAAIRIQQEIGTRPELARSYGCYASLLRVTGERDRAREFLTNAIGMFREMGMTWDLERAEAALWHS